MMINRYSLMKTLCLLLASAFFLQIAGCSLSGYTNSWDFPEHVRSVYVEMFDTQGFRRGHEFTLTDAIAKRVEAQTPYKVVSDRDLADTVLSGSISSGSAVLAGERYTGSPLENEALVSVTFSWKEIKTGKFLVDKQTVRASGSFSTKMGQDFDYAIRLAVNKAADKVVEQMENPW